MQESPPLSINRVVLRAQQRNDLRCELERSLGIDKGGASCIFYGIHVGIKIIVDIHLSVVWLSFPPEEAKMLRFGPQRITFFGARSPCPPS